MPALAYTLHWNLTLTLVYNVSDRASTSHTGDEARDKSVNNLMKSSRPAKGERHGFARRMTPGERVRQFVSYSHLPFQSEGDIQYESAHVQLHCSCEDHKHASAISTWD